MKHDLYANFLEFRGRNVLWDEVKKLDLSLAVQMDLAALFLTEEKERGRRILKEIIEKREFVQELNFYAEQLSRLGLDVSSLKLKELPEYSHLIQIAFTLRKPYLSRDDKEFYIIDNPVAKDLAFKLPIIRSSSWKGALRWVTRDILGRPEAFVERLFGNEKGAQQTKGRLIFYTTFLNKVSLDVITPLGRETRTPRRGPIPFEIAPKGSKGTFSLLYFPFDLLHLLRHGDRRVKARVMDEMRGDLEALKEAIPNMLTTYGFGAKKTSGYGVVEDVIDFRVDSVEMEKKNFEEFRRQMDLLIDKIGEN